MMLVVYRLLSLATLINLLDTIPSILKYRVLNVYSLSSTSLKKDCMNTRRGIEIDTSGCSHILFDLGLHHESYRWDHRSCGLSTCDTMIQGRLLYRLLVNCTLSLKIQVLLWQLLSLLSQVLLKHDVFDASSLFLNDLIPGLYAQLLAVKQLNIKSLVYIALLRRQRRDPQELSPRRSRLPGNSVGIIAVVRS